MFQLRGHHLFCLIGYRGMGYSKEYVENMTHLHQTLRENPQTLIQLVKGPDQLCEKYPNSGEYHCQDQQIYEQDEAILQRVGILIGQVLPWEEIESRIRQQIVPTDIQTLCATCSWRSYGVCEEGMKEILEGKGLRKIN